MVSWRVSRVDAVVETAGACYGARMAFSLGGPARLQGAVGTAAHRQVWRGQLSRREHGLDVGAHPQAYPRLGTFVGGFQAFFDALADKVRRSVWIFASNTKSQISNLKVQMARLNG